MPDPSLEESSDGRHVALYVRVSTAHQATEGVSLDAQEQELRRYAAHHWPTVPVRIYRDEGVSAFTPGRVRPQFEELVAAIGAGRVTIVAAHAQDRFTRGKVGEWEAFSALCHDAETAIYTLDAGLIEDSPDGELLAVIRAGLARRESSAKSHRIRTSFRTLAESGRWRGATTPVGFDRDPATKNLVPNRDAPIVRELFERYDNGESIKGLARFLRSRGYGLSPTWIRNALRNPHYAGLIVHREALHEGNHEPLVPPELFHRVQDKRDLSRRTLWRDGKTSPFGALARCHACGALLCARQKVQHGRTYYYFKCVKECGTPLIVAEYLVGAVLAGLAATALTLEEKLSDSKWALLDYDPETIDRTATELERVKISIQSLVAFLTDGTLTKEEATPQLDALRLQRRHLEIEHSRLTRGLDSIRRELSTLSATLRFGRPSALEGIVSWWLSVSSAERRAILGRFLDNIVATPDAAVLTFKAGFTLRVPLKSGRRSSEYAGSLYELGFSSPNPTFPIKSARLRKGEPASP